MNELKGTRTEQNLLTAFAGESQARNRYDYFAKQAKKDGYVQVSMIFEETAMNEKEHAKRFFKFLQGGEAEVKYDFPAGMIMDTATNLKNAADGENHEHSKMYLEYAKVAEEEGFKEVANVFLSIAKVEKQHEKRFRALRKNILEGTTFEKEETTLWKCNNCGYIHEGKSAPETCPACAHGKKYFEVLAENW